MRCEVPPPGWWCSREAGHDGPCAARSTLARIATRPLRWWQRSKIRACPHSVLRAIWGDQINHTPGYRRLECMTCGRYLDGPPELARLRREEPA